MIVTTGKVIKIEACGYVFERSCETPGCVTVRGREGALRLPGPAEAEKFIAAYRRAVAEDVPYRETGVEDDELAGPPAGC